MQADESAVVVSYPHFFGHPLERHIALRHAFLEASGRPSGACICLGEGGRPCLHFVVIGPLTTRPQEA